MVNQDLETLQHKQTTIQAKISEYKRRHLELSHRVLGVMVRQEIQCKAGVAIGTEEELLRTRLEGIQAEVNAPTQMKVIVIFLKCCKISFLKGTYNIGNYQASDFLGFFPDFKISFTNLPLPQNCLERREVATKERKK